MKYIFISSILFFTYCTNSSLLKKSIRDNKEEIIIHIIKNVERSISTEDVRNCPNYDEENLLSYYKTEVHNFSIDKALSEIGKWSKDLDLEEKDTIILSLFYPAIGFDPTQGFTTEYFIYQSNGQQVIFGESTTKKLPFNVKRIPLVDMEDMLDSYKKYKSGCETGFLAICYLTSNLRLTDSYVAVGITPY